MDGHPDLPPKPPVKLFVKAGFDGGYGACPLSQRIHMILSLKSSGGALNLIVCAVNLAKPSVEFKQLELRHVPAISHLGTNLDNLDEILQYIEDHFHAVDISHDNVLADKACKDVFSKFCFFVKSVSKDSYGLTSELDKLDKYLAQRGATKGLFLCGNRITYLDCDFLPKLHQIRVASRELKGYDIPAEFGALWNYLKAAYSDEVFRNSCPSDQEIILHWMEKTGANSTIPQPQRRRSTLMDGEATFSFQIPGEKDAGIESTALDENQGPADESPNTKVPATPDDPTKKNGSSRSHSDRM